MPEPHDSLLTLVADALAERKAEHPRVLDVRRLTDITDFMVVASGRSRRQVAAIGEHVIERAKQAGRSGRGDELIAIELREALDCLAHILGTVYTDDILDRIFSKFCIGK